MSSNGQGFVEDNSLEGGERSGERDSSEIEIEREERPLFQKKKRSPLVVPLAALGVATALFAGKKLLLESDPPPVNPMFGLQSQPMNPASQASVQPPPTVYPAQPIQGSMENQAGQMPGQGQPPAQVNSVQPMVAPQTPSAPVVESVVPAQVAEINDRLEKLEQVVVQVATEQKTLGEKVASLGQGAVAKPAVAKKPAGGNWVNTSSGYRIIGADETSIVIKDGRSERTIQIGQSLPDGSKLVSIGESSVKTTAGEIRY